MCTYLVESSHTAEECVWALKQILAMGPSAIDPFYWGCKDGEHIGWAIVEAEDRFAAQALVPRVLTPKTRVIELCRFSPAEIRAFHQGTSAH